MTITIETKFNIGDIAYGINEHNKLCRVRIDNIHYSVYISKTKTNDKVYISYWCIELDKEDKEMRGTEHYFRRDEIQLYKSKEEFLDDDLV